MFLFHLTIQLVSWWASTPPDIFSDYICWIPYALINSNGITKNLGMDSWSRLLFSVRYDYSSMHFNGGLVIASANERWAVAL